MDFSGRTLVCTKNFFIFQDGKLYYCVFEDKEHFYIANRGTRFNVSHFKLEKGLKKKFITKEEQNAKIYKCK